MMIVDSHFLIGVLHFFFVGLISILSVLNLLLRYEVARNKIVDVLDYFKYFASHSVECDVFRILVCGLKFYVLLSIVFVLIFFFASVHLHFGRFHQTNMVGMRDFPIWSIDTFQYRLRFRCLWMLLIFWFFRIYRWKFVTFPRLLLISTIFSNIWQVSALFISFHRILPFFRQNSSVLSVLSNFENFRHFSHIFTITFLHIFPNFATFLHFSSLFLYFSRISSLSFTNLVTFFSISRFSYFLEFCHFFAVFIKFSHFSIYFSHIFSHSLEFCALSFTFLRVSSLSPQFFSHFFSFFLILSSFVHFPSNFVPFSSFFLTFLHLFFVIPHFSSNFVTFLYILLSLHHFSSMHPNWTILIPPI